MRHRAGDRQGSRMRTAFGDDCSETNRTVGRRGRNRTCNPQIRNLMLYPIELRARSRKSITTDHAAELPWAVRARSSRPRFHLC